MARKTNFASNGHDYYRVSKVIGHDPHSGKPIVKQFTGKSKKEAEAKRDAFLEKKRSGFSTEAKIFGREADDYIYNVFARDPKKKDSTKELYISAWKRIIEPSDLYFSDLKDVDAKLIQEVYNNSKASYSARNAADKLMKLFYAYLDANGVARDVTKSLVVYKDEMPTDSQDDIVTWTEEEAHTILNNFDKADPRFRFRFLVVLAIYAGCRISELLALRYSDIVNGNIIISKQVAYKRQFSQDGKEEKPELVIKPPKTPSSNRLIPVNPAILEELKRHRDWHEREMERNHYKTDYIFTTASGGFIDRHDVQHAMERYYKRIGIEKKKFHAYRATFATTLAHNGVPVQTVSSLLGHADVRITLKYYIDIPMEDKTVAVNSLRF